ncbi:hypothetical protein Vafri_20190 [Volvox africanus]|uniref:Uncharacterized protein n=1 Tax=Volvox africanus TaxID=51714 RepID=A0A8J4FAF6_9CHLO|nr:hypothetical protein Vafri_20190 [Volvox africanus]
MPKMPLHETSSIPADQVNGSEAPAPLRLWSSNDVKAWDEVRKLYNEAVTVAGASGKSKAAFPVLDRWYRIDLAAAVRVANSSEALGAQGPWITRLQLEKLVEWKLARGQWRPRLLGYARAQPAGAVEAASAKALSALRGYSPPATPGVQGTSAGGAVGVPDTALRSAMDALTALKGVGPATASALLSAACPHVLYMGDEALAACRPAGRQSDYSLKAFLELASRLQQKARQLNQQGSGEDESNPGSAADCCHPAMGRDVGDAANMDELNRLSAASAQQPSIGAGGDLDEEGNGGGDGNSRLLVQEGTESNPTRWTAADVERCLWAAGVLSKPQVSSQPPSSNTSAAGYNDGNATGGRSKRARR